MIGYDHKILPHRPHHYAPTPWAWWSTSSYPVLHRPALSAGRGRHRRGPAPRGLRGCASTSARPAGQPMANSGCTEEGAAHLAKQAISVLRWRHHRLALGRLREHGAQPLCPSSALSLSAADPRDLPPHLRCSARSLVDVLKVEDLGAFFPHAVAVRKLPRAARARPGIDVRARRGRSDPRPPRGCSPACAASSSPSPSGLTSAAASAGTFAVGEPEALQGHGRGPRAPARRHRGQLHGRQRHELPRAHLDGIASRQRWAAAPSTSPRSGPRADHVPPRHRARPPPRLRGVPARPQARTSWHDATCGFVRAERTTSRSHRLPPTGSEVARRAQLGNTCSTTCPASPPPCTQGAARAQHHPCISPRTPRKLCATVHGLLPRPRPPRWSRASRCSPRSAGSILPGGARHRGRRHRPRRAHRPAAPGAALPYRPAGDPPQARRGGRIFHATMGTPKGESTPPPWP